MGVAQIPYFWHSSPLSFPPIGQDPEASRLHIAVLVMSGHLILPGKKPVLVKQLLPKTLPFQILRTLPTDSTRALPRTLTGRCMDFTIFLMLTASPNWVFQGPRMPRT